MNFLCHSEIALYVARETHLPQSTVNGLLAGAVLGDFLKGRIQDCLLYTSPSPRDGLLSRMPSSA